MAETIEFNLEMDNRGAKEALAEIAKIAESASGFMNTLASAMNTATKTAGGLSAVLAGPTGLGLALSAVSLALQILPNLFSDSTEEIERQRETVKNLKNEYSKLTRESLQYRQEKVKEALQKIKEDHPDERIIYGGATGIAHKIQVSDKERFDKDYERYQQLHAQNKALQETLDSLGDIENIENRIRINEDKRRELSERNYKTILGIKGEENYTYDKVKETLGQWIEYDKKLLYGKSKPAQVKKTFDELEQELKARQTQEDMLANMQSKGDYSLQLLKKRHLDEMIALYKQYGKDVTDLQKDLSNTEAAINKRTDIGNVQAAPMTSVTPIPKELAPTKEFGNSQAYADDWQKSWADREREELDMSEAAELKKADMYANAEEMKTAIHEKYSKYRSNIDKEEAQAQMDAAMGAMNYIGGAVGQNTVLGKAAAVANATMSTYEAAAKALTAGPIFGPILAGVITALGLANVSKILSIETPQMGGYAKGGIVVGEAGPEIIAPMQDYASGQALLVQQTVMEARRAMSSSQYAQASGDNQTLIRELQKLNSSFEGYSSRPITITKDAIGKIVSQGNSQLRKSRV
jgi:hypothetical protein